MTVTRAMAATAMLAGLAVGTASTAWASPSDRTPEMSGHYVETDTAQNGQTTTGDWYFTPCGAGWASAANTPGGRSMQVQLVGGKWAGVQLVISDAHAGLRGAIEAIVIGAAWQRCRVHF